MLVPERVGSGQGRGLGWALAGRDRGRRVGRPRARARSEAALWEAESRSLRRLDTKCGNGHSSETDTREKQHKTGTISTCE